jgi:hypothetical protein
MTTDEAILYLALGFMIIIGIWLSALTYMVLKRHKVPVEHKSPVSETIEEEIIEEEIEEELPAEEEVLKAGEEETS